MLDARLLVLKLILESLGYDTNISTVAERKRDQKAIYLTQICGLDLGYRYGWYLMGPYSTGLARDYYALQEKLALGEAAEGNSLKPSVEEKLCRAEQLIRSPIKPNELDEIDWLELLASWHFLRNVSKKDEETARTIMQQEKPRLAAYLQAANNALGDAGA